MYQRWLITLSLWCVDARAADRTSSCTRSTPRDGRTVRDWMRAGRVTGRALRSNEGSGKLMVAMLKVDSRAGWGRRTDDRVCRDEGEGDDP